VYEAVDALPIYRDQRSPMVCDVAPAAMCIKPAPLSHR
jgi:hypothetical protein